MFIQIVYPDPSCKMGFALVEKRFHPVFDERRYVLKFGMINPVLGCIRSQREVPDATLVDFIGVQLKENAEGRPGEKRVCGLQDDVKMRNAFRNLDAV